MKYCIIEHKLDNEIWYTARIRKFFIWFDVKHEVDMGEFSSSCITVFSSREEAEEYIKRTYKKPTKSVTLTGEL